MNEMARAIAGLKDGKAPGGDGIPAEVWKHGGDNLFSRLHQLITNAWEVGYVPQTWKDASIVAIYKKGDRTDFGNYRGISFSTAGYQNSSIPIDILLVQYQNYSILIDILLVQYQNSSTSIDTRFLVDTRNLSNKCNSVQ